MSPTNQDRRLLLQLAVLAAPALAAGAWLGLSPKQVARRSDLELKFHSAPDGIHWIHADGTSGLFLPLGTAFALTPGSTSPGNGHLTYSALDRRTGSNIWTVPVLLRDGQPVAGTPARFFHSGTFDVQPRFSQDGRRISWAAREAGRWSIREGEFKA